MHLHIDYTSLSNPQFFLSEDEDELDLPDAWRDDDDDDAPPPPAAAVARATVRTAALRLQAANAARGAPVEDEEPPVDEDEDGEPVEATTGRLVRRPARFL